LFKYFDSATNRTKKRIIVKTILGIETSNKRIINQQEESGTMLKGYQKQYLKGCAHGISPLVIIGQNGCTPTLIKAINASLETRELIKIKFNDFKEKAQKEEILSQIVAKTAAILLSKVGHTAVLFRQNKNPEKRKFVIPAK
jgi:RNA-binding protein